MADEDDIRELRSGNVDLARRDFRDAKLLGVVARERDFSGAHLERANLGGADLSGSTLKGAHTLSMKAPEANLSSIKARSTTFVNVNFRGANLQGSDLSRSSFTKTAFDGADLRKVNFQTAIFNEGCSFDGCNVDVETRFDEARIFRPLARQNAFRFYRVERGVLIRNEDGAQPQTATQSAEADKADIERAISSLLSALKHAEALVDKRTSIAGLGHNNPPGPLEATDYNEIVETLEATKAEVRSSNPSPEKLRSALRVVESSAKRTLSWAGQKLNIFSEEFARESGKTLASKTVVVTAWLWVTDLMGKVAELLTKFVETLP